MANRSKEKEISGQKLWCGSLCVIQYLLNHPHIITGCSTAVVEMGAGTGVLGMMCKRIGALNVFLTDHDEISLDHMKSDAIRNRIEAGVVMFDWFKPEEGLRLLPLDKVGSSAQLLVVAGDVMYKGALLDPFFQSAKTIMGIHSSSQLILCHVPRAGVEHIQIVDKATEVGFVVEEIPKDMWNEGQCFEYCETDDLERARLYRMLLLS